MLQRGMVIYRGGPVKPRTHVAFSLLATEFQLDIQKDCDGYQLKFQLNILFCDPWIAQPIFIQFQMVFTIYLRISYPFQ